MKKVTIHSILTHTSGLESKKEHYTDTPGLIKDLISDLEHPPKLLYKPSSTFGISNHAFGAIGLFFPALTGISFNDFVQERVFNTLGMFDSTFSFHEEKNLVTKKFTNSSSLYHIGFPPRHHTKNRYSSTSFYYSPIYPSSGAYSTGNDMLKFLTALIQKGISSDEDHLYGTAPKRILEV